MKFLLIIASVFYYASFAQAAQGDIITLAGGNSLYTPNGVTPSSSVLANAAYLAAPSTVDLDAAGNIYITDAYTIKKIDRTTGQITVVAGTGTAGYSGDGGLATQARLSLPYAVAFDATGNLYFSDERNHVVRKIDASGVITTVVGTSILGYTGDGGDASQAKLNAPEGLTFDAQGNLYIVDYGSHVLRKVDMATNIISTVVGNGLFGFSGDGGLASNAQLYSPVDVALDSSGNIFIADSNNGKIRKITVSTGIISSWKTGLNRPYGLTIDAADNVYFTERFGHQITKVDALGNAAVIIGTGVAGLFGDGGVATAARLNAPLDVAADSYGNLFIVDSGNKRIRFVGNVLDFPIEGILNYPSLDEITLVNDLNRLQAKDSNGLSVRNTYHNFILPTNHTALQQFTISLFASDAQGAMGARQVSLNLNRIQFESMGQEVLPPANVNVFFRAYNAVTKKPFRYLTLSDLMMYEDNLPITVESTVVMSKINEAAHRVDTVLMFDVSSSITATDLLLMKQAAKRGVLGASGNQLLVKDQRVAVYVFDDAVSLLQDFTSDPVSIAIAIDQVALKGVNTTNLYGAVVEGMSRLQTKATVADVIEGQMLLITDGQDTAARVGFYTAKNAIKQNRLHVIGVNMIPAVANIMQSLTPNYTAVADFAGIEQALLDVASYTDDLAYSFYRLDYTSPAKAGVHNLGVRAVRQSDYDWSRNLRISFDTKDFTSVTPPPTQETPQAACFTATGAWWLYGFLALGIACFRRPI